MRINSKSAAFFDLILTVEVAAGRPLRDPFHPWRNDKTQPTAQPLTTSRNSRIKR
jgi:hypothetical protein